MKPSEILTEVARRFETGEWGWIQHTAAADENGRSIPTGSPNAVAFCMMGGVARVIKDVPAQQSGVLYDRCRALAQQFTRVKAFHWNDAKKRKVADVVALLRKAAKLAADRGE